MTKLISGTHAPMQHALTTADRTFFDCTPDFKLFSVCKGVPSSTALANASCFLAAAIDIGNQTEPPSDALWGAIYLVEMAKAIVDAVAPSLESARQRGSADLRTSVD